MFTVSVKTNFWASHQITLPDGSKEPLHGHNWLAVADISRDKLGADQMVMDFCQLKDMLEKIITSCVDGSTEQKNCFQLGNASAEQVAEYVYKKLEICLPAEVKLETVSITEEPGCVAKFSR